MKPPTYLPLPFSPETEEALLKRFPDAFNELCTNEKMQGGINGVVFPDTLDRKHNFDFEDGIRMVATYDRLPDGVDYYHLSFSAMPQCQFKENMLRIMHAAASRAARFAASVSDKLVTPPMPKNVVRKGVLHLFLRVKA